MGRRFLLILVFLLPAPPSRAQDEGVRPPAPDATTEPPPPQPLELPPMDDRLPPVGRPDPEPDRKDRDGVKAPAKKKAGPSPKAQPRGAAPARDDRGPAGTALDLTGPGGLSPVPSFEEATADPGSRPGADAPGSPEGRTPPDQKPASGALRGRSSPRALPSAASRPPGDPEVTRTDGPAAAGESGLDGLPVERLPAGKQSVAVTVDVQSPANMNLHQRAKVRLVVRNTGASEVLQVRVRDELPEGLRYHSSDPPATVEGGNVLNWTLPALGARSDQVMIVEVEPVKAGELNHGASVWIQTGSAARTRVFRPHLKIELIPGPDQVLRGQAVEFKARVTNDGDGPARNVTVTAKLSPGLRYGSSGRGTDEMITEPIPVLAPDQSEDLEPLVADALVAGEQSCTVAARSPDVIPQDKSEEARSVRTIKVVEPRLEVKIHGPSKRCTDTNAVYEIAVTNPGTAPARKVRVVAFVPPGIRPLAVHEGAKDSTRYDSPSRRVQWSIETLEAGQERKFSFEVRVGDVGTYEITAEASGAGGLKDKSGCITEVFGMPDVDLVVSERQRVVDVGGATIFLIRLRNYGTKEAKNILLSATFSKNVEVTGSFDVPPGLHFGRGDDKTDGPWLLRDDMKRGGIERLGPGKELIMGLQVKVTAAEPKVATCRVQVKHDDLSEPFEDMASVKVLPPSSQTADSAGR